MISMLLVKEKLNTIFDVVGVHCKKCNCTHKEVAATVLPAKSDSDVTLCLQSYLGLIIDRSLVYQSYPQDRINTQVIYRFAINSSSEVYTFVFYLAIVNKVLRHCHSWLARQ